MDMGKLVAHSLSRDACLDLCVKVNNLSVRDSL